MASLDMSPDLNAKRKVNFMEDEVAQPAKRVKSEPAPFASAMARDPDLKWPGYEVLIARKEEDPPDSYLEDLQSRAIQARDRGEPIPVMNVKWSPFFHALETSYADLAKQVNMVTARSASATEQPLLTIGESGLFYRDINAGKGPGHNVLMTKAGMCVYFWFNSISGYCIDRVLPKGQSPASYGRR